MTGGLPHAPLLRRRQQNQKASRRREGRHSAGPQDTTSGSEPFAEILSVLGFGDSTAEVIGFVGASHCAQQVSPRVKLPLSRLPPRSSALGGGPRLRAGAKDSAGAGSSRVPRYVPVGWASSIAGQTRAAPVVSAGPLIPSLWASLLSVYAGGPGSARSCPVSRRTSYFPRGDPFSAPPRHLFGWHSGFRYRVGERHGKKLATAIRSVRTQVTCLANPKHFY